MALSKSVNYFVNTIYYDPIAIGALNTNDSEAIQSTLPHRTCSSRLISDVSGLFNKHHLFSYKMLNDQLINRFFNQIKWCGKF